MWLYDTIGWLGVALFTAFYPLIVMTGMHHAFTLYMFQSLADLGYEPIVLVGSILANLNQGIASLAVGLKSKKGKPFNSAFLCGNSISWRNYGTGTLWCDFKA